MFDVGASELLLIVIVAVVVIGPKDMPMALRTAGRWIGKMRKMSNHFRSGIDAMVREAELEEMERKWREQNEAIMKAAPTLSSTNPTAEDMQAPAHAQALPDHSQPEGSIEPAVQHGYRPPEHVATELGAAENKAAEPKAEGDARQAELHLPPPPP
jgi:sec-independent protein translocase protein TatB